MSVLDAAARLVVAGVFVAAAVGKLTDLRQWRATLYLSRLTRPWVPQLSLALPAVELALAAGVLTGRPASVPGPAAALSALLLIAFTAYLLLDPAAAAGCHCFGARSTPRPVALARNLALLALLGLVVLPGAFAVRRPLGLPLWLAVAGVLVVAGALVLPRLLPRGRRRPAGSTGSIGSGVSSRSGASGRSGRRRVGRPTVAPTPVGREAAPFDVPAVGGGRLALAALAARADGVLLVFVEPGCAVCARAVPLVVDRPDTVFLVAVRDAADAIRWAVDHGVPGERVGIDDGGAVADAYRVVADPSACRIDARLVLLGADLHPIARPAVGIEAITALLRTEVLHPEEIDRG